MEDGDEQEKDGEGRERGRGEREREREREGRSKQASEARWLERWWLAARRYHATNQVQPREVNTTSREEEGRGGMKRRGRGWLASWHFITAILACQGQHKSVMPLESGRSSAPASASSLHTLWRWRQRDRGRYVQGL